jgi:hypothetical protein
VGPARGCITRIPGQLRVSWDSAVKTENWWHEDSWQLQQRIALRVPELADDWIIEWASYIETVINPAYAVQCNGKFGKKDSVISFLGVFRSVQAWLQLFVVYMYNRFHRDS